MGQVYLPQRFAQTSVCYAAIRHIDTTSAAMTNIRDLRRNKIKATKSVLIPPGPRSARTALWATSDFSTGWCNATSHALALALQLEPALRILSSKLTHSQMPQTWKRLADCTSMDCSLTLKGEDGHIFWENRTTWHILNVHTGFIFRQSIFTFNKIII